MTLPQSLTNLGILVAIVALVITGHHWWAIGFFLMLWAMNE